MDEAFACPDCGTTVEIKGLAPGRQVRCGFCHRLLEVPYFPRVAEPNWKRRRFERPWWVRWAWSGLGSLGFLILVIAAVRFLDRQSQIALDRSSQRLIASSHNQEEAGDCDRAVVELDYPQPLSAGFGQTSGVTGPAPLQATGSGQAGCSARSGTAAAKREPPLSAGRLAQLAGPGRNRP